MTLQIPDDVAIGIQQSSNLPLERRLLQLAAIQAHFSDFITELEVMDMLGFEAREELYEFFKRYDVRSKYTAEDFESERAALDKLLS